MENNIINFIENTLNIKLYNYQKAILKHIANKEKIYIIIPPRIGYSDYKSLINIYKKLSNYKN